MPASVAAQAETLTRDLIVALGDGIDLQALSASTLAMKLRQFASGAVYTGGGDKWTPLHSEKVDAALDIVDELQGEPCLVFYWFKHEKERLLKRFQGAGKVVATADDKDAFDLWNDRRVEVLLAHPQSAGHGLNLQHGGHNILWYALPWSHELWVQGNGRLARTGQTARQVNAHVLLCGAADWRVLAALDQKGDNEQALLDYLLEVFPRGGKEE
jgi:hypothetical protein